MKPWAELPVAAQVKRTRRALAGLLPRWGLGDAELKFLQHGENTTFRAFAKRASFMVRVSRHGWNTPHETACELQWVEAVNRDLGAAPQPVRTRDGELVVEFDIPGIPPRHVSVFEWVEGPIMGRRHGLRGMAQLGELMARLHNHALGWRRPRGFTRRYWDNEMWFQVERGVDPAAVWVALPREHANEFTGVRELTAGVLKQLQAPGGYGLLHADLHAWNVVRGKHGLVAIDFNDCGFAPWVQDLAVTAAMPRSKQVERFRALMEGYHRVREFPRHQLPHVGVLVAARYVCVCLWITNLAAENAAYRKKLGEWQDTYLRLVRDALAREYK